jgi:nucleoside-diphosphate-sugar epimerase
VNETHPIRPQTPRAQRRADAEHLVRAWARRNGVHASILRVPGIYAADRLPLERLRAGVPAILAAEDSHTNHIHADDLARIVVAALRRARPNRVYHASDDSELKMGDYLDVVANARGLPHPPRISRAEAQKILPPLLLSFMNESRRLTNRRMKRELKVALRYPHVAEALS